MDISFSKLTVSEKVEKFEYTKVYPKVSGLVAWSENCKWYSSLPIGVVIALLCESV
jgi:hypothetical protein